MSDHLPDEKTRIAIPRRGQRRGQRFVLILQSKSGGGKTYSLIHFARGLIGDIPKPPGWKPEDVVPGDIAFIDTERRGEIYATEAGGFNYYDFPPPWTPERYTQMLEEVERDKPGAIILDSASHEWNDVGGVLEAAEANGFSGLLKWQKPKLRHQKFTRQLYRPEIHTLISVRGKTKLEEQTVNGKKVFVDKGIVPIQDKDFTFDAIVVLTMIGEGRYEVVKCPKELLPIFDGSPISIETGRKVREWIAAASAPVDHELEALKMKGENAAFNGMKALEEWWKKLTPQEQRKVQFYTNASLKTAASDADRRRLEEAEALAEARARGEAPDDDRPVQRSADRPVELDAFIAEVKSTETKADLIEVQKKRRAQLLEARAAIPFIDEFNNACLAHSHTLPDDE